MYLQRGDGNLELKQHAHAVAQKGMTSVGGSSAEGKADSAAGKRWPPFSEIGSSTI